MFRNLIANILLYLLISVSYFSFSQKLEFKAGFGNYEGFNIGLCQTFNKFRLEYGIGSDINIYGQGFYNEIHASIGRSILKNKITLGHPLYLNFKTIVWNLGNPNNVFSTLSLSGESSFILRLSEFYQAGIYGGIVWSTVFRYERKNYNNVGFIKDWQPNFGFTVYRKLK